MSFSDPATTKMSELSRLIRDRNELTYKKGKTEQEWEQLKALRELVKEWKRDLKWILFYENEKKSEK